MALIYSIDTKRGSGSSRYSGGVVAARAAGNRVLQKGMAPSIGQCAPVFLPGEPPDREAWQATVHRAAKHWDMTDATLHVCTKDFLSVAALPQ